MDGGENGSKVLKDFKGNKSKFFEGSIEMQERIKKKVNMWVIYLLQLIFIFFYAFLTRVTSL